MDKQFQNFIDSIKEKVGQKAGMIGAYRFTLEDVNTGEKTVQYFHNIIPLVGRQLITNNLTDPTPDNDMLISHALLGDDDTAVAEGDTTLGNETYRNAIASKTNSSNIAYATAYYNQTECVGTYKEAGIVCDGSDWAGGAGKDTGILLSHVNIDVTKSNVQKLTIDWVLTLLSV